MIFIIVSTDTHTTVTEWPDATPSARKAYRRTGCGFTLEAPSRAAVARTLTRYPSLTFA